ncbi:MAG: sulfite exporter TauE/SafE family protein [Patescibacteria group bacterium]|jgi:cytochrome c biogenesis protein CcdA|nr:sulfite exporter TauE/SafE family protein [Patescibacteria group bacterium]
MLLLLLSFFAGILTVFAPCILPLLPVIIGGSVGGGKETSKARPYIIAISLIVSIVVFTLLLKATTALLGVDPAVWRYISGGIVVGLGIVTVFPMIWEQAIGRLGLQAKSQEALSAGYKNKGKYLGPVLIGAALGPVFTSCSPTYAFVVASVLPSSFIVGLLYLLAYSAGLAVVLLAISLFGQRFLKKFKFASDPHSGFRRGLGIIFIVVGLSIITGFDKQIESWLLTNGPLWYVELDQSLLNKVQ